LTTACGSIRCMQMLLPLQGGRSALYLYVLRADRVIAPKQAAKQPGDSVE
jgi:hypothetical protein